jgi:CHAD domain-containing protein
MLELPLEAEMRDSIAGVIRKSLAAATGALVEHEDGIHTRDDAESVHQARVAARRIRSDLRSYRRFLDASWAAHMRAELQWLGNHLGAVRDMDVLIARVETIAWDLPAWERPHVTPVLDRLRDERKRGRDALATALADPRYLALREQLVAGARQPPVLPSAQTKSRRVLVRVVTRQWKRLKRGIKNLDATAAPDQLHDARRLVRHARYALDTASSQLGQPARRHASALASLQDTLGELQDSAVSQAWLRTAAGELADPRTTFVVGELVGLELARQLDRQARWPAVWRRVSSKNLRRWQR